MMKLSIGPYTLHFYRHNQSLAQRAVKHRKKRIKEGRCIACGSDKMAVNKNTGKIYRKCSKCRAKDAKASLKRYYRNKL